MSLPTNGPYALIMSSFFGYLSQVEQQKLWADFLQKNGLTTNPSNTDITAQTEFVSYVNSAYNSAAVEQLSPLETQRRLLAFAIFDAIITMLKQIQRSTGELANQLQFLTNYQAAYTEMIKKVPLYVGGSLNVGSPDLSDPSKFTLGYGNITLQDVLEYALATNQKASFNSWNPNSIPQIQPPLVSLADGHNFNASTDYYYSNLLGYQFTFVPDTTNHTMTFTLTYQNPVSGNVTTPQNYLTLAGIPYNPNLTLVEQASALGKQILNDTNVSNVVNFMSNVNLSTVTASQIPFFSGGSSTTQTTLDIVNSWIQNARQTNAQFPGVANNTAGIPWAADFNNVGDLNEVGDDTAVNNQEYASNRAQKNTVEQQYIQNLTAARQIVKNRSDTLSNSLNSTEQAATAQAGVMNSLIQQMQNIMNSIFK